jgi:hypothetical protein
MPRLAARRRPALAMTPKQHAETSFKSCVRLAAAERAMIRELHHCEVALQFELAGIIMAIEALARMDDELAALAPGKNPFLWPVFQEERQRMDALYEEHPPDVKTARYARAVLDELSAEATCDELAVAAVGAATYFFAYF